ncbi:MAG TPA: nucleotidyltransferase domain-containing protein [Candidatus Methylomirabilis sp.]|jgi:predicted nucleotidyltransferase
MKTIDNAFAIQAKDKEILSELGRIVRGVLPGATIYLFGSAAKGVRQADSDLDVLIITNTHLSRQDQAALTEAIYELELARGAVISTLFYSREEWDAPLTRATPFHTRVEAEAVLV